MTVGARGRADVGRLLEDGRRAGRRWRGGTITGASGRREAEDQEGKEPSGRPSGFDVVAVYFAGAAPPGLMLPARSRMPSAPAEMSPFTLAPAVLHFAISSAAEATPPGLSWLARKRFRSLRSCMNGANVSF